MRLFHVGHLIGANGFHVKSENERFFSVGSRSLVIRTSNLKISRRRLADYVKKLHQEACRTCSTIIFFFIPPIMFLICDAVVAVVVVVSLIVSERTGEKCTKKTTTTAKTTTCKACRNNCSCSFNITIFVALVAAAWGGKSKWACVYNQFDYNEEMQSFLYRPARGNSEMFFNAPELTFSTNFNNLLNVCRFSCSVSFPFESKGKNSLVLFSFCAMCVGFNNSL